MATYKIYYYDYNAGYNLLQIDTLHNIANQNDLMDIVCNKYHGLNAKACKVYQRLNDGNYSDITSAFNHFAIDRLLTA